MPARSSNREKSDTFFPSGGLRYLAELAVGVLLFCITLHTFLLAGLIVPVTVSGGSMAKTILGPRREVECDACHITIACGHERMPTDGKVFCLNCGWRETDVEKGQDLPGERALIDRTSLALNPPHRWEVIVFRCPDNPGQFCIKRVVGLPGEEIELKDGDVYVNGKIARKTLDQCLELAQIVNDNSHDFYDSRPETSSPHWEPRGTNQQWKILGPRIFFLPEEPFSKQQSKDILWLDFYPYRNQPVKDDYDYNQSESRRLNRTNDLMLRFEMSWQVAEEFYLRSVAQGESFQLTVSEADHEIRLTRDNELVAAGELPDTQTHLSVWEVIHFDCQWLVSLDGLVILNYAYEPQSNPPASESEFQPPWSIGMRSGQMDLRRVQVLRDIYYTVPTASRYAWGSAGPVKLAEDEYFVLGDNSPISADSRIWRQPGINRKSLVGRLLGTW